MSGACKPPSWITRLRHPHLALAHRLWKHCHGKVQGGPFAGMTITPATTGALLPPYLLGSFEAPLHDTIRSFDSAPPRHVVNIGAGDGYYTTGFAHRWPSCNVTAFDPLPKAHANTTAWATASGVADRITLLASATPENLESRLAATAPGSCLIWCDCEGAEAQLADPEQAPSWITCPFVIELHPWVVSNIEALLTKRFTSSHYLSTIQEASLSPDDFPPPSGWRSVPNENLHDEGRHHPGRWLVGHPRQEACQ